MKQVSLLLLVTCLMACGSGNMTSDDNNLEGSGQTSLTDVKVKNVILLIGDGMGLSQISSAFYYKETVPNFTRFTNIGLIRTSSSRQKVTDSAAGATAFASGIKTYNGAIGMNDDTVSVPTIVEILTEQGWKTGVIATSSITHATPASFYAHVPLRRMEREIAAQLVSSSIDFFAGGGMDFFDGSVGNKNTVESLFNYDFKGLNDTLESVTIVEDNKYGFLLAGGGMPRMVDGRGDFLPKYTEAALEYFSMSKNSFFLMVEGSQIDWGGHANDEEYLVSELIDFDNTLGIVLDFAERDGNTLVVVTADHETGGYTLSAGETYEEIKGTFSTGGHSATLIPVLAYGPGAELFNGIYENTEIFHKMMELVNSPN